MLVSISLQQCNQARVSNDRYRRLTFKQLRYAPQYVVFPRHPKGAAVQILRAIVLVRRPWMSLLFAASAGKIFAGEYPLHVRIDPLLDALADTGDQFGAD